MSWIDGDFTDLAEHAAENLPDVTISRDLMPANRPAPVPVVVPQDNECHLPWVRGGSMDVCATCGSDQEYRIRIDAHGVPHGSPGHQITYRWTDLSACLRCGAGVLVHFDHDCFAPPYDEPWDMNWQWPATVEDVHRLEAVLTRCPDSTQGACLCPVHQSLRASDQASRPRDATATIVLTEDELPQLHFRT